MNAFEKGMQYLPNTSKNSGTFVVGEFNGKSIQNVFYDPNNHLKYPYNSNEALYKSSLRCNNNQQLNIDNECLTIGHKLSQPFEQVPNDYKSYSINQLFDSTNDGYFPYPSSVAMYLMKERGRY
jgi:hypothetical protein